MRCLARITHRLRAYVALAAVATLLGVTGAIQGAVGVAAQSASDQTDFFLPAAQQVLDGHPWRAYTVLAQGYSFDGPPLPLLLEALAIKLAEFFSPSARAAAAAGFPIARSAMLLAWVGIVTVPLAVGLCALVAWIVRRGRPDAPRLGLLAFGLLAASPLLWLNTTTWGHIEEPMMMALVVLGVWACQRRRDALGGIMFGLALMSRTTALLPVLAFVVLLALQREPRRLRRVLGAAAIVCALVLVPFLLGNPVATIKALLAFHGTTPVGNSIWSLLRGTPFAGVALHADIPLAFAGSVAIALWAGRRHRVTTDADDVWGVLALAGMLVPLVAKMIWPYYFVEPIATLLIWELLTARRGEAELWRWPVVSVAYALVASTLLEFMGTHSLNAWVLRLTGVTNAVCVGAVVALAIARFSAQRRASVGKPSWGGVGVDPASPKLDVVRQRAA